MSNGFFISVFISAKRNIKYLRSIEVHIPLFERSRIKQWRASSDSEMSYHVKVTIAV